MSPGDFFIEPDDLSGIETYTKKKGFIAQDESLRSVTRAGEGNMNLALRLATDTRSIILKQSRPWVEKYPQIPAPAGRALVEIAFYEEASTRPAIREAMPKLLGSDPDARVLILEDLGIARDFTSIYASGRLSEPELKSLVAYLIALHEPRSAQPGVFANREMRALNHEHIFRLPLDRDNGVDLDSFTPGLQDASETLKNDRAYVDRVTALGESYLADGDVLVHGDYFPGSWLRTPAGIRIIDPEFCFIGPASFDVGFMLGHMHLADQPRELIDRMLHLYPGGDSMVKPFAGVEIMRRLIGVAQLPLKCDIERKRELLELSRTLVLSV